LSIYKLICFPIQTADKIIGFRIKSNKAQS
jgi:hypothetical protein